MITLDEYRLLNIDQKIDELERIELLIKFTERAQNDTNSVEIQAQLEKLHYYYNLGWGYF